MTILQPTMICVITTPNMHYPNSLVPIPSYIKIGLLVARQCILLLSHSQKQMTSVQRVEILSEHNSLSQLRASAVILRRQSISRNIRDHAETFES